MSLWRHRRMQCFEELDNPSVEIMQFYVDTQWELIDPVDMVISAHNYILRGDRHHLTHTEWDSTLHTLELLWKELERYD